MAPTGKPAKSAGFTIGDGQSDSTHTSPERPPKRDPGLRLPAFTSMKRGNGAQAGKEGEEEGEEDEDEEAAAYERWANQPQTPNIAESAQQLRRSLSVHGLHELAHMPPAQIRKSVGNKIWRPQDELTKLPSDWERLAVHLVRAGMRSFNLAFMLRGSVMLVFVLIRAIRSKKAQGKAFLLAVFGADNIRFGLMFAVWSIIYKAAYNALRLASPMPATYATRSQRSKSMPPGPATGGASSATMTRTNSSTSVDGVAATAADEAGSGAVSGTATPRSGYHELEGKTGEDLAKAKARQKRRAFMRDPRSRIWHAYVAGALSGLAILVERKDSRISLAQQLLVRGLEGTYNSAHAKNLITIPHGAVLTFGLACGQIMYAWLNAPQTLPRGYISWITTASHVAPTSTYIHRDILAQKAPNVDEILKWFPNQQIPTPSILANGKERYPNIAPNKFNRRGITGSNVAKLKKYIDEIRQQGNIRSHVPCELIHPWENSHVWSPLDRFLEVTRWILPVYMTLHFVPAVFLRMRSFRKDPIRVFLRSLFGSIRSSSFLGAFVIIFQTSFCTFHSLHDKITSSARLAAVVPPWLLRIIVSPAMHWLSGFATCLSLFIEHKRRRTELAMYVLPKGMESAWSVARQRSWLPFVPGGDLLLTSAGMSLIMGAYAQNPEHLSGIVRRTVYQFVGRN